MCSEETFATAEKNRIVMMLPSSERMNFFPMVRLFQNTAYLLAICNLRLVSSAGVIIFVQGSQRLSLRAMQKRSAGKAQPTDFAGEY